MSNLETAKKQLCEVAALAYDRHLLDSAGGNFSHRYEDKILCTPRYSGSKRLWRLRPEEIIVLEQSGAVLEGEGETSREIRMHLAIYQRFPKAGGVCHAHPRNVLVFANLRKPIPPTSEQTEKYGTIPLSEEVPAHSEALANAVVEALLPQQERLAKHAIACLLPYHGITVAGRDLFDAYDALERLDGSCHILIARASLESSRL